MENQKKKILIVEDEKKIAQVLAYNMKKEGYDCEIAYDGETGLAEAIGGGYDLILLDIMLPKMNGFEVCEKIRLVSQVPIIFVTAREEEKDKILGLDTGADDYVNQAFLVQGAHVPDPGEHPAYLRRDRAGTTGGCGSHHHWRACDRQDPLSRDQIRGAD